MYKIKHFEVVRIISDPHDKNRNSNSNHFHLHNIHYYFLDNYSYQIYSGSLNIFCDTKFQIEGW